MFIAAILPGSLLGYLGAGLALALGQSSGMAALALVGLGVLTSLALLWHIAQGDAAARLS